jgi:phytoene desaturase
MTKRIAVIGSGFSSLSAASYLAKAGYDVEVFEKNEQTGGRARQFTVDGFKFDMGPSWYWMPDVFESYFKDFGHNPSDYYNLKRLDPSYVIYFKNGEKWNIPADYLEFKQLLESKEKGAGKQLDRFLADAQYKYEVGINDLVTKPSLSITEFIDWRVIVGSLRLNLFSSFSSHVRKYFKHPNIIELMEFPVLFLGAKPSKTPALYSLMNYADIKLGTWYPDGGMHKIVEGMTSLAKSLGVKFHLNTEVTKLNVENKKITSFIANGKRYHFDVVVGGADYNHIEQKLLNKEHRRYDEAYWNSRTMAPSSLIYYLGFNKKVEGLEHHNLFFDESFEAHADEIYENPKWPKKPLFYVSCPSKIDQTVAPENGENLFVLIPTAPDLIDQKEHRDNYLKIVFERMERLLGHSFKDNLVYCRSYAHADFIDDYHAYKGNAYGLANTLKQTAIFKPSMVNPKVKNLFYTGQLTTPGPGVPPSLISGKVVAELIKEKVN